MKKKCELCTSVARAHCESDQASLCWTCDYKVHTANFLVARHSRTLLCHVCQAPTPWSASGTKLGPTVSVCDNCLRNCRNNLNNEGKAEYEGEREDSEVGIESDESSDEAVETLSDEDDEEEEEEEADNNEDNQVVPWSPTTPPPPASSSSNSDGESLSSSTSSSSSSSPRDRRKRTHENVSDLRLNANQNRFSSQRNASMPPVAVPLTESPAVASAGRCERDLKRRRLDSNRVGYLGPNSLSTVESVERMHRQENRSSAGVSEFSKLSEDSSAVDCDFSECSQPQD